jgi:hypothetical protein
MLSFRMRLLGGGAAALTAGALTALPGAAAATATAAPVPTFRPGPALYDQGVQASVPRAAAAAAARFTQYKATVKVGSVSYTYVMAGKNPAVRQASPASTITAKMIPLIIKFSNGDTWDPAKTDSCDPGASPLTRVTNSPIEKSQSWTWGGTRIGTGQVTGAYQRADFWKYTQPTGINPAYAVNLAWSTLSPITINVPSADAAVGTIGCGNGLLGGVNIDWLDAYLRKTVIPSLASQGISPSVLPVFLLHNVVEYIGSISSCCVLGYHNAYATAGGVQTYGLSMYDNSGAFTGSSDISALSHEIAEWQNDPYTSNPTPAWGHVGQVTGCQSNLEVGDPLSGTNFADKLGGFTYHPQQLAFFSWFYHQSPSLGVNGWYSDRGRFTAYAAPCT